jgi:hypothetical protein
MNAPISARLLKCWQYCCASTLVLSVIFMLAGEDAFAQATVTTLANTYNKAGAGKASANGVLTTSAKFNFPAGIALDSSGTYMFVADYNNNAIRLVYDLGNKSSSITYSVYTNKNGINHPIGVAVDPDDNIFVLNYGTKGANGSLMVFSGYYLLNYYLYAPIGTLATNLVNAAGLTLDYFDNTYITVKSNTVIRVTPLGVTTVVGVIKTAKTALTGIAYLANGKLAIADSGNNGIWLMDPANTNLYSNAVKLTGFHGTNDILGLSAFAAFNHPEGVIQAGNGVLVVADYGNNQVKLVDTNGTVSRLFGVNSYYWKDVKNLATKGWNDGTVNPFEPLDTVQSREPFGLAIDANGNVYDTEDYYDLLREATGTGLLPPPPPPPQAPSLYASAGYGVVNLAWTSVNTATNYNVKRSITSGGEATIFSTTGTNYTDTNVMDGTTYYYEVSAVNTTGEGLNSAEVSALPLYSPAPTNLTVTATNFGSVSLAWAPSAGATSYNIKRATSSGKEITIASTASLTYTDTDVNSGTTYYYVVSAVNPGGENPTNSAEVMATVPIPAPPSPTIGWFDFEWNGSFNASVFHAVGGTPYITYNDLNFAIEPNANGVATKYTTDGSDPTTNSSAASPYYYQDGLAIGSVTGLPINAAPNLVIKAVNTNAGGFSAIVTATFQFQTGNPSITGDNAAQFTINDVTAGAQFLYTTDGSDPRTNANATIVGPIVNTNGLTLSLQFPANTNVIPFSIAAFKSNYATSSVVTTTFSSTNFVANTISFGFASGEASSVFLGSPGQTFYAPVTLTTLPGTVIYSLQFNVTVTNLGAATNITPGDFDFQSMLMKPIPNTTPVLYTPILPEMFTGTGFTNLEFSDTNNNLNLLGVGWAERAGETNLYDTTKQTLITYSLAHDDLFPDLQQPNGVIVGGYSFQIPGSATNGQQYQIQIGRPSATDDGIGAPGSAVYIAAPTNGSTAGGAPISALKYVTITNQIKYLVGDVYPFGWFNAGDFGSGSLVQNGSADVEQVFEAAVYSLNAPPPGSDFFDAMDSCGNIGILDGNTNDANYGYYTNTMTYPETIIFTNAVTNYTAFWGYDTNINQYTNSSTVPSSTNNFTDVIYLTTYLVNIPYNTTNIYQPPPPGPTFTNVTQGSYQTNIATAVTTLFSGNDTNINQVAFGDGVLDVCDVYVTYRRSLDPSLTWYARFWNNGQRVATVVTNQ